MNKFNEIISGTRFVAGVEVNEFEKNFSEMHDVRYTLGLSSGTDGNHLSILANNIGPGDEVIVPVNTFIATAEGITLSGAKPIFVDIDQVSYNIDAKKAEHAISNKTKAINPVHLYGNPADMNTINSIASQYNLKIIEDASQAHISCYQGKKVGNFSDVASWSFYPGKNLGAWGEAGAVTTDDEYLYNKMKKLSSHGSNKKYHHDIIGHNYRMSELQAAVLNVKLKHLEEWTKKRRKNALLYHERLKSIPELVLPTDQKDSIHVYHLYVIRTPNREKLQNYLLEHGISTLIHYPFPLHLTRAYRGSGFNKGDFPVAEKISDEILSLPMFPELTEQQISYVSEKISQFFKR